MVFFDVTDERNLRQLHRPLNRPTIYTDYFSLAGDREKEAGAETVPHRRAGQLGAEAQSSWLV